MEVEDHTQGGDGMGRNDREDKVTKGYTEKQLLVINGETDAEQVDGRIARHLLNKARELGDEEVAVLAQTLLDKAHERAVENNRQRVNKRHQEKQQGIVVWKQPKSNDYTEHQRMVVRGEIPIEDVNTKELIHIHLKAKNNGDIELSERILSIIIDRRNAVEERVMERAQQRFVFLQQHRKRSGNSNESNYQNRTYLTPWEKDVLRSVVDLRECPVGQIRHMIAVCERTGDAYNLKLSILLLQYKEHPETVYVTQDYHEAVDNIEFLMGKPLRRPETWFTE